MLDESQQNALTSIVHSDHRLNFLVGRAGYGKTFLAKHIVKELVDNGINPARILFASTTGKAAKVLQDELAELNLPHEAMTIHRMLGCQGPEWIYNKENPLEDVDFIFLDEMSMAGSTLFARILYSVCKSCRFLIIGDSAQLNPVYPGAPFRDAVNSKKLLYAGQIHELVVCHRQKDGSLIADACERVRNGKAVLWGEPHQHTLGGKLEDDLFLVEMEDRQEILKTATDLCREWWRAGKDWICLVPQHSGEAGIKAANQYMQAALNGEELQAYHYGDPDKDTETVFKVGDRVIQTKNNYKLEVFNGFIGSVIDTSPAGITVNFDGQIVVYSEMSDIFQLQLGYAISIHKSQGSGFKYGVVIADKSHSYMWSRQLLYVALSRFKRRCFVVGQKLTAARAVRKNLEQARDTWLSEEI